MRFVVAILLTLVLAPTAVAADRQTALETSLVRQINAIRRDHGLRPLVLSSKLGAAAAQHSREMGADGYFEHSSVDGTAFWRRIQHWYTSGPFGTWAVGENLFYSSPDTDAAGTATAWMNSPEHRANMLSRTWREIGVSAMHFDTAPGVYDSQPVTIVTADFGYRH